MIDIEDINSRLTIAGAIREPSTVGQVILDREFDRQPHWSFDEVQVRLAELDKDRRRVRAYLQEEGLGE